VQYKLKSVGALHIPLGAIAPIEWPERLFRPNSYCSSDGCRNFLNRPLIFSARNNGEAVRLCVTPSGAKTFRVELPCAGARVGGWRERLTGHLSVRRKGHFEFRAGRRSRREGLAGEEGRLNVPRRHRFRA